MVRQRKHDRNRKLEKKEREDSGNADRPAKQDSLPTPKDSHDKPTADDNMQYVSNSRSKARLQQLGRSPSFLRWLLRLRLTKVLFVVIATAGVGFMFGRLFHRGLKAGPGIVEMQKQLKSRFDGNHPIPNGLHGHGNNNLKDSQHLAVDKGANNLKQYAAQHSQDTAHQQPDAPLQQPALHHEAQQPAVPGAAQPPVLLKQDEHLSHAQQIYDEHMAQHAAGKKRAQDQQAQQQPGQAAQHPALQPPVINPPGVAQSAQQPAINQPPGQQPANGIVRVQAKQPQIQDAPSDVETYPYHIIQTLTNTHKMPHLKNRFIDCTKSILAKASINLHFFFVVDEQSRQFVIDTLQDITNQHIAKSKFQFHFIAVEELAHQLAPLVSMLQESVTGGHPYYQDAIFFLSVAVHRGILPSYVQRIIMLDTDLKFMTDIKGLFDRFDLFTGENIMGLAREMQPVYRHLLSLYRSQNPGTKVGDPPPNGLTGFNSGVVLLDLEKMRASTTYRGFVNAEKVKELSSKYSFKGHLGDQDFYTLISLDRPDLFHILPCSWNRQLCVWWRDKGYKDVFDQYFRCDESIYVYHGNCNTPIPYNLMPNKKTKHVLRPDFQTKRGRGFFV